MAWRESTKAKKLQKRIAYYLLSGRKRPNQLIVAKGWAAYNTRVWHVKGPERPKINHEEFCPTCSCAEINEQHETLCKLFTWNPTHWSYRWMSDEDFQGKRPCKKCLAKLSRVAHEDD